MFNFLGLILLLLQWIKISCTIHTFGFSSNSPYMDSNDSTQTALNTNSHLNNPSVDAPTQFLDAEPSPNTFSQPPLQPITPPPIVNSISKSSHNDATPIFALFSNATVVPIPVTDDQLDLDFFNINQQHVPNTNSPLKSPNNSLHWRSETSTSSNRNSATRPNICVFIQFFFSIPWFKPSFLYPKPSIIGTIILTDKTSQSSTHKSQYSVTTNKTPRPLCNSLWLRRSPTKNNSKLMKMTKLCNATRNTKQNYRK